MCKNSQLKGLSLNLSGLIAPVMMCLTVQNSGNTEIFQYSQLSLNEYHVRDILNIEHPCAFDTLDDYDLLIFRETDHT